MLIKSINIDFFTYLRVIIALVQAEMAYISPHFPEIFQGAPIRLLPCTLASATVTPKGRNTLTIHDACTMMKFNDKNQADN